MSNTHGIQDLDTYQLQRLRTETFLGSRSEHTQITLIHTKDGPVIKETTWVPALLTCFREVMDNSLDEFTKSGVNGVLRIDYDESKLMFKIHDNGRGIPFDWNPETQMHLATQVLTRMGSGRNFNDDERSGVAGMNGMGGAAVNNVSKCFSMEIVRKGKPKDKRSGTYKFSQKFTEGNYVDDSLQVFDPVIKSTTRKDTGTSIEFELSDEVFKNRKLPTELVYSLLREIAATNINHTIIFNGIKISVKPFMHRTLFEVTKPITYDVDVDGFKSKFLVLPNMVPDGILTHSLVNGIPTYDGGAHVDEFKTKFFLGLNKILTKESKRRKLYPNRSDLEEGILIYNVTKMDAPFFGNQAKTKLINEEVSKPIAVGLTDEFFSDVIKKNKDWIDSIYERCAERTHRKDSADIDRAAKRAMKSKVAKLRDATARRGKLKLPRHECSLFLAEGESAIGEIMNARDPSIHGAMALKGKILNVSTSNSIQQKNAMKKKVLASESTSNIMNALGLVIGEEPDFNMLRFGTLQLAMDADLDGANIVALVCYFLYEYWPQLFDINPLTSEPFIQVFTTPLIILTKGKSTKYFYPDNIEEYISNEWKGWQTLRAKGLGSLTSANWADAIDNIRSIPLVDDGNLKETLDLIFNADRSDDRKVWMS